MYSKCLELIEVINLHCAVQLFMSPDFDNLKYEFVNLQLYDTSFSLLLKIDELVAAGFCRHKDA